MEIMGVLESLDRRSRGVKPSAAALIVVCIAMIYFESRGQGKYDISKAGKEFYSDDNGASWFFADATKGSPFNHNGATAYRALVFRCDSGQPFVGYLAKYSADQMSRWHAEGAALGGQTRVAGETPKLLEKPGDTAWKAAPAGFEYPPVPCPHGQDPAVRVNIFDPASGAK